MKRIIALLSAAVILCVSVVCFAAGADLTIDELSLDNSSYSVGDSAEITFGYNVPYDGVTSASASFDFDGLENVKLASARTLVCDDSSCNMHNDVGFLSFSGSKLTLGAGYSGSVTFSATVKNESNVKVKVTLKTNNGSTSKSTSASVSDYAPLTPTPESTPKQTSKPTSNPTAKPTSKPTAKPTAKSTSEPTGKASNPKTGGMSYAAFAVISILSGTAAIFIGKKKS